MIKTKKK